MIFLLGFGYRGTFLFIPRVYCFLNLSGLLLIYLCIHILLGFNMNTQRWNNIRSILVDPNQHLEVGCEVHSCISLGFIDFGVTILNLSGLLLISFGLIFFSSRAYMNIPRRNKTSDQFSLILSSTLVDPVQPLLIPIINSRSTLVDPSNQLSLTDPNQYLLIPIINTRWS